MISFFCSIKIGSPPQMVCMKYRKAGLFQGPPTPHTFLPSLLDSKGHFFFFFFPRTLYHGVFLCLAREDFPPTGDLTTCSPPHSPPDAVPRLPVRSCFFQHQTFNRVYDCSFFFLTGPRPAPVFFPSSRLQ